MSTSPSIDTIPGHREPWGRFLLKLAATAALIIAAGMAFTSRYHLGIDTQQVKCIPGVTFYLVDKKDTVLERNAIYAFSAKGLAPFFDDGTEVVKYLRGLPGDHIEITSDEAVIINGAEVASGLVLAGALHRDPADFRGKTKLAENAYWFMGESAMSFDSRYWGSVSKEQIIGRAYPLF